MAGDFEKIKLIRAKLPNLGTGTYHVKAEQAMSQPVGKTFPAAHGTFHIGGRKFSMDSDLVYSVYPAENAQGNYSGTLPHIILSRAAYPWLHTSSDERPWLALISLSEREAFTVRELTISDVIGGKSTGIYFPACKLDESGGESPADPCRVLDLDTKNLPVLMPREDELALLAHVRMVDLHDTSDQTIPLDGCFSTLVCNRLPDSPAEKPEKNTVFLISLDGYEEHLPEGPRFGEVCAYQQARFVVLHAWSFYSEASSDPGFCKVMREIDSGALSVPPGLGEGDGAEILKRGYVPLRHILRTGEQTVSFYRGPLVPCAVESVPRYECRTADGEIRYDPANGVFDMSYAAAWQLGRLIALADKSISHEIYQWRRFVKESVCRSQTRQMWHLRLGGLAGGQENHNQSVQNGVLSCIGAMGPLFAGENAVTPAGDSTGLERESTKWLYDMERVQAVRLEQGKAGE